MTGILDLIRNSDFVVIGRIGPDVDPDRHAGVAARCLGFEPERLLRATAEARPLYVVSEPLTSGRRTAPLLFYDGRYVCFLRQGPLARAVAAAIASPPESVWELAKVDSALQLAGEIRGEVVNHDFRMEAGVDPLDDPAAVIAVLEAACRYVALPAESRQEPERAIAAGRGPLWDWLRRALQRDRSGGSWR